MDTQTDQQIQVSNIPSVVACAFCRGNVFTKLLYSNDMKDRHTDTRIFSKRFKKYAVGMCSNVTTHIPSFIKAGSGIPKQTGWIRGKTALRSHKLTLQLFQNKVS